MLLATAKTKEMYKSLTTRVGMKESEEKLLNCESLYRVSASLFQSAPPRLKKKDYVEGNARRNKKEARGKRGTRWGKRAWRGELCQFAFLPAVKRSRPLPIFPYLRTRRDLTRSESEGDNTRARRKFKFSIPS